MRVHVKAGAKRDGTLTALQLRVVSNTGAYGNHGAPVLEHACAESISVYRCANKKVDGYAVYTNTVPAGAFRGYGLPQTGFAVESAIDELARAIGMDAARIPPPQRGAAAAMPMLSTGEVARRRDLRQLRARPVPRSGRRGAQARRRRGAAVAGLAGRAKARR